MPLRERKYKYNQAILKKYGDKKYKLTHLKVLRTVGIEDDVHIPIEKGSVNDIKLDENISRAKSTIFELALCNPWEWWCTFTLNPHKYDRFNLEQYHKEITQWLRNQGKKYNVKIKFILVPEQHKDGAWHMHGFMSGIAFNELVAFNIDDNIPRYIKDRLKEGQAVYNWPAYVKKFGWVDLERIKNPEACSKYVTKYINKDLARSVKEINAHTYYCSRGLERAKTIKKGTMSANIIPDYENDYVRVKWYEPNTPLENLINMIL